MTVNGPRRELARRMAEAARHLLDVLEPAQREAACWAGTGAAERTRWFYTPTDHGGLALANMTPDQQRRTHQLVATGLSRAGYVTAAAIMGLENILDHTEGWTASFARPRGRDPQLYWIAVFGSPDDDATWGWRFGGHHISLNVTIEAGEVVSATPCFFGADPASSPLLGPHPHRPLAGAEDLGRELLLALAPDQLALAVISPVAPVDIVGVNRPHLGEGDRPLPLPLIFRGQLPDDIDALMSGAQANAELALGLTDDHLAALAFTRRPKGVAGSSFTAVQREILTALLGVYANRLPDELAADELTRALAGLDDPLAGLHFAWAGGIEPDQPHYYRLQGPELLVEYDNTQRNVNHVHTVWRDLRRDFGGDPLASQYQTAH
jgi:Protein of unknown function (DUF3500)